MSTSWEASWAGRGVNSRTIQSAWCQYLRYSIQGSLSQLQQTNSSFSEESSLQPDISYVQMCASHSKEMEEKGVTLENKHALQALPGRPIVILGFIEFLAILGCTGWFIEFSAGYGSEYFYEPREDEGDKIPTSLCMKLPPPDENVMVLHFDSKERICIDFLIAGQDLSHVQGLFTLQHHLPLSQRGVGCTNQFLEQICLGVLLQIVD